MERTNPEFSKTDPIFIISGSLLLPFILMLFLGIRGFEFLKMDGQTDQFKQSLKDLTNMEDNKWPPIVYGTAEGDDQAQPSKKWAYIKWKAWSEGLPIWDFEIWGQVHPANLPDIIEQKDLDPRNFNHINRLDKYLTKMS